MIVSDDIDSLTDDSQRIQMITNLRDSVYSQGRMLNSFSNSLQISRVEGFDISSVVGVVDLHVIPTPPLNSANYMSHAYIIIIVSIAMIVMGVMCLFACFSPARCWSILGDDTITTPPLH